MFGIVDEGRPRRRPSDIARLVIAAVLLAIAAAGRDRTHPARAGRLRSLRQPARRPRAGVGGPRAVWRRSWRGPAGDRAGRPAAAPAGDAARGRRRGRRRGWRPVGGGAMRPTTLRLPHRPDAPRPRPASWPPGPYLTRPGRRLLEAAFWLSALAAAALGEGLPGAVAASLVLAWGAAALAHLCFGSPAATPSADQVADSLRDLGVDPTGLALAPEQTWGTHELHRRGRRASCRSRSWAGTAPTPACSPSSGGSSGTRTPGRRCR